jgi:hypothetical protein
VRCRGLVGIDLIAWLEIALSKSVFISHAVKDKILVKEIVDLIEDGMGVPEDEIFCSSLKGYGIPSGKNFVTYIKEQLIEPKVVVLVLTPSYFESRFCLSELGAAWIKSHEIFPILVPPLAYGDVKDVLLGTQLAKVDDDIRYNDLLEVLKRTVSFKQKSQTKWDTKRRAFLKAIRPILKNIAGPSVVSAADYQKKIDELSEAQSELDTSEREIRKLKDRLAATEALKDKKEVSTLNAKYSDAKVSNQFNFLIDEIKKFRSVFKSREVMKFVLSDYYGKPYQIGWHTYREEFEEAARFEFIELGDSDGVNWSKRQMRELKRKLDDLEEFISENRQALEKSEGNEVPLDASAQDFWEYHYEL